MMNSMPAAVATVPLDDADLVQRCLADDAGSFSEVVARYQTLICSLTYNATGSVSRSEDLAQEVFVAAWKELRTLREPAKLRSWLCGIARRLIANTVRREGREPVCAAEELADEHHAPAPSPVQEAISREEEAILWRSLEKIPETYREPLILFYREGQSVERVAEALDLTEDAAKQRLSRGRKLLQEQVAAFIEGALRLSTPGRAFTLGVLAMLPLMKTSATAATIGTAAAKAGAAATGISWLAMASALIGPIVGCLGGWFGIKASLEAAQSEKERELIRRQARRMIALVVFFFVLMGLAMPFEAGIWREHTGIAVALGALLPFIYMITLLIMIFRFRRAHLRVRTEEASHRTPEQAAQAAEIWKTFEYKSPQTFLGLPLLHVRTGRSYGEKLHPAVGWIAIGDVAIGVLVAVGGFSLGGVSIGGISFGLAALGGVAVGGFALAGLAIGVCATGGAAIAYLAHGGCAFGWHAAEGGMAAARDFALGDSAWAAHANDALARETIPTMRFFQFANALLRHPIFFGIVWFPLLLVIWQAQRARKVIRERKGLV